MYRKIDTLKEEKPVHERLQDAKKIRPVHFYTRNYAIFRIGKSFKTMAQIKSFQKHMTHETVYYADKTLTHGNRILIGSANIQKDVENYIVNLKLRSNANIGKDLLLTASPDFFRGLTDEQREEWLDLNIKFLKDNFGPNCIHCSLHVDETSWHLHCLIIPKFQNEKTGKINLASSRYFDGIEKLVGWQDNYSKSMQIKYKSLNRGVRYSKAKHTQVKEYYNFINKEFDEKDIKQAVALAKNSVLVEKKINEIQKTIGAYQRYNDKSDKNNAELIEMNKILAKSFRELKSDRTLFKETIKALAQIYDIPAEQIKRTMNEVTKQTSNDLKGDIKK
jgi:hypothetical protein